MKRFFLFIILLGFITLPGCLIVSKVSYHIAMKDSKQGTVTVSFYDIKSDAIGNKEFEEDKKHLFEHMLKSEEFIESMRFDGKFVKDRKLELKNGMLNGTAVYDFSDIEKVEGFRLQEGFYFLTLQSEDSVLTTNGQIVQTEAYKRIIWPSDTKVLEFEILSGLVPQQTRELAPFYQKGK